MIKKIAKGSIMVLLLSLALISCSDDKLKVGIEILPDSEILDLSADTLEIECFTYKGLAGYANGSKTSENSYPIGQVFDYRFGETSSEVAMEFSYNSVYYYGRDSINDQDEAISLTLYLPKSDIPVYGEENGFNIDVFLLNSPHSYGGSTIEEVPSDLYDLSGSRSEGTDHSFYNGSNDNPMLDSNTHYIAVTLDDELKEAFMDSIYTNGKIYEMMAGVVLKSRRKGEIGALQSFYPKSTKIVLEYKRPGVTFDGQDSTLYTRFDLEYFQCNYKNKHKHSGAIIDEEGVFRDTTDQASSMYIQGLGGTRGIVKVEGLADFKSKHQGNIGINLAELVLPIDAESIADTNTFRLPVRLKINGIESDGSYSQLPDEQLPDYYVNGYFDADRMEYRANISEYVNRYMLNDLDYLLLNITTAEQYGGESVIPDYKIPTRAVLNSGLTNNTSPSYIRIIYTEID